MIGQVSPSLYLYPLTLNFELHCDFSFMLVQHKSERACGDDMFG
jgi:hypothetical protein